MILKSFIRFNGCFLIVIIFIKSFLYSFLVSKSIVNILFLYLNIPNQINAYLFVSIDYSLLNSPHALPALPTANLAYPFSCLIYQLHRDNDISCPYGESLHSILYIRQQTTDSRQPTSYSRHSNILTSYILVAFAMPLGDGFNAFKYHAMGPPQCNQTKPTNNNNNNLIKHYNYGRTTIIASVGAAGQQQHATRERALEMLFITKQPMLCDIMVMETCSNQNITPNFSILCYSCEQNNSGWHILNVNICQLMGIKLKNLLKLGYINLHYDLCNTYYIYNIGIYQIFEGYML